MTSTQKQAAFCFLLIIAIAVEWGLGNEIAVLRPWLALAILIEMTLAARAGWASLRGEK